MLLPAAFSAVSYYDDEYRGDLIVTDGVLYFFPQQRTGYDKIYLFGGIIDRIINWIYRMIFLFLGAGLQDIIEIFAILGRFVFRNAKRVNRPKIAKIGLWQDDHTSQQLRTRLDVYIDDMKKDELDFTEDSLPVPIRFEISDIENVKFKWRFRFDAKFDSHDFGISPLKRNKLKTALFRGGFLK
jgi:hypothetical protein